MANICDLNEKKIELSFPTSWEYKVITAVHVDIEDEVKDIFIEKEYSLRASNNSQGGKYKSHNIKVTIVSHEERLELFEKLKSKQNIKFVL